MKQPTISILLSLLFTCISTIFIWCFWDERPFAKEIETPIQQTISVKDVEKWVHSLADSPFKSNLLTVLGAEYGGDSIELNKLMKAFIEMRMQELSKQKTI